MSDLRADLVLEGGGVKGIGLVGAVSALDDSGYRFNRISGTSAGAVIGCLAASGLRGKKLRDTALSLDYKRFRDPVRFERIPLLGPGLALLHGEGLFKGDYALEWLTKTLAELGVHTFGDLRLKDPHLPPEKRYRLVVNTSDVTRGELVRLPWDYERLYGLDPNQQSVAEAVRASLSIPFFFRPVHLTDQRSGLQSTLVDGGLLSNFPIDSLDRHDGQPPRWPTFGIKIMPNLPKDHGNLSGPQSLPIPRCFRLLEDTIDTMLVGNDQAKLDQPWVKARTISVNTDSVSVTDFGIDDARTQALVKNGYEAAQAFLTTWDWAAYVRRHRSDLGRRPRIPAPHSGLSASR